MQGDDTKHWTRVAEQWIGWASSPEDDAFPAYRDAFARFVGKGKGAALEVGCGEGRVSRLLRDCGYRVTATDPVEALAAEARNRASAEAYVVAPAAALPFEDDSFDLVLAYNVLMDVEDVPSAVREMARVLRPSGRMIVSLVHPFADRGRFEGKGPDAPFVLRGSYFGRLRFDGVEQGAARSMHFAGWSQPLQDYMAAFEAAGLAIASLAEPWPDLAGANARMARRMRVPLFLWLALRQLPALR
jgi:SAM-dependent methyltransferase